MSAATPRDRSLDHLSDAFRPKAFEIIARCTAAGIAVMVIETLRSAAQHAEDIATGHSWVAVSKHQTGDALDLCPYSQYIVHGAKKLDWDAADPIWKLMRDAAGVVSGVRFGFDWPNHPDVGHFELASIPVAESPAAGS